MVLALATRGAMSFETRVLFGRLAFALPPHGRRSPTAKGMESKGLRARGRSRKTSPVSPVMSSGMMTVCPLRCTSGRRRLTPGRANRDEHLRIEDDEEAGGAQSLSSRRLMLVGGVESCGCVSFNVPLGGRVDDRCQSDRRRRSALSSVGDASRQFNASLPVHSRTSLSPTFQKSATDPN